MPPHDGSFLREDHDRIKPLEDETSGENEFVDGKDKARQGKAGFEPAMPLNLAETADCPISIKRF